jgi:nitrite reductase/ring-hydroxylating ferredoxin subunit
MSDADLSSIPSGPSRRTVLVGGAAVGAAGLLAGCARSGAATLTGGPAGGAAESTSSPAGAAISRAGAALAKVADVPVGGGTVVESAQLVITQPEEGTFKAFSAVCTHQDCLVSRVADQQIHCVCHDSFFSIADGSVLEGPATTPLPETSVIVAGTEVRRA